MEPLNLNIDPILCQNSEYWQKTTMSYVKEKYSTSDSGMFKALE